MISLMMMSTLWIPCAYYAIYIKRKQEYIEDYIESDDSDEQNSEN